MSIIYYKDYIFNIIIANCDEVLKNRKYIILAVRSNLLILLIF